ncbi:MAG: apolipoprotein N-acyltransferase, partial [Actinomycetota bacterium]|nr:apolipoprotein N-acyltransferase [Actinomycetota bacterium]
MDGGPGRPNMTVGVPAVLRRPTIRAVAAGVCIAGSVPPWGWWPLAFIGFALTDRLLAETTTSRSGAWRRFRRMWLVAAAWLFPAMLWMFDLTPPGYVIAGLLYSAYFGLAAAVTPPTPTARRIVLPGAVALAEVARWYWPFGGVPLANIALGQVDTPLVLSARVGGPLLVIMLVVVIGQMLSALWTRESKPAAVGAVAVLAVLLIAVVHPRASVVRDVEAAIVQGGGPVRTRASSFQEPVVLARHVEATKALLEPVDFILWPENVVNPGRYLSIQAARETVAGVAAEYDAPVLAGWFHPLNDRFNFNFHTTVLPGGRELDRYDKVRIVPFGEFVPFRSIVEATGMGDLLPTRDALPGTEPPVLDTPVGPVGVSISWEAFFERRARESVANGAQILTNPTNGSSFWLTQVHTQQVASNQLRAVENDRWLLMAAPTGLSGVIDADGRLLQRTDIGERSVLTAVAEMRTGRTLAGIVGPWPVVLYG